MPDKEKEPILHEEEGEEFQYQQYCTKDIIFNGISILKTRETQKDKALQEKK